MRIIRTGDLLFYVPHPVIYSPTATELAIRTETPIRPKIPARAPTERPHAIWMADRVVQRPIAELRPYEHNSRSHSAASIAKLKASVARFGFVTPILLDGHLNLRAIAEQDGVIAIGGGRLHRRRAGEPLFPERMDLPALEAQRKLMGNAKFNCQYQQNPIAPDGSPLRWEWFGCYDEPQERHQYQMIVQSWDTGMSADPRADYSVCTTWGFWDNRWWLLDLLRDRLDYPELRKAVVCLADRWTADKVLIEKAASGIPLLQDLFPLNRSRYRAIQPLKDKEIRFAHACAPIEEGKVLLPREAPWLADFRRRALSKEPAGGGTVTALPFRHDPAQFPVFQDLTRDHPPGCDALCPLPAFPSERRGSAARARHRREPRNGALLVAQVRPALRRRDPQETGLIHEDGSAVAMAP